MLYKWITAYLRVFMISCVKGDLGSEKVVVCLNFSPVSLNVRLLFLFCYLILFQGDIVSIFVRRIV